MQDANALAAINGEQLVTATDRLLLRGGQLSKRRHIRRLAEGSQPHIVVARFAEGSQPHIALADLGDRTQVDVAVADAGDRTQPDLALACAWETTVPHPVPVACGSQPYVGSIVAAPFTVAPHPVPPARDVDDEYLSAPACALVIAAVRHARTSPARELPAATDASGSPSSSLSAAPSYGSMAFIAAAPFASDSYPALHGRASQSRLDDITGPLPAGFDPALASQVHAPIARNAAAPRIRGAQPFEPTAIIRRASSPRVQVFAFTVVIPALVGVVIGLAALL